jgi:hypothetical protein
MGKLLWIINYLVDFEIFWVRMIILSYDLFK